MNEQQLNQDVAAFVDGEISPEAKLRLLGAMANDPAIVRQVIHQQQLATAVQRAMEGPIQAPLALTAAVERLADQALSGAGTLAGPTTLTARFGRWMPAAAAAVLLALVLAVGSFGPMPTGNATYADVIPPERVETLSRRHNGCTKKREQLFNTARFPEEVDAVPAAIAERLGELPYPSLDFSSLGYRFHGIGECRSTGRESVHMVYLSDPEMGRQDALSLWIHPDRGQEELSVAQLYKDAHNRSTMLVWRHNGLLYYLMGDSATSVTAARELLASR